MMRHNAGFTLLELMLVMLLLGIVAGAIVATLPAQNARPQAARLALILNQAAAQAATEGQPLRLMVREDGWQLQRMVPGTGSEPSFLPGYQWQAYGSKYSQMQLPQSIRLQLLQQQRPLKLPAALLIIPEDDMPALTFEMRAESAPPHLIRWQNGQATEDWH